MAEVKPTASAASAPREGRSGPGFELRLERGGAFVRLADRPVEPGLLLDAVTLEVPGVRFPFNAGAGAVQFRHVLSDLVRLEILATEPWIAAAVAGLDLASLGLDSLSLALREGFAELTGRVSGGAAFSLHAVLLPDGAQGIAPFFFAPRIYGPSPVPAALLPHLAARTFAPFAAASGGAADPVPRLLRRLTAPRGWKVPRAAAARVALLRIGPDGARIAWDRAPSQPVEPPPLPDLLAALEGARAFGLPEAHLARGDLAAARDAWLAAGAELHAHPFAAERLLSLLLVDERFHDEALDLAHDWLARRPDFAPALCAEAWIRIRRGEPARAGRALATLAAAARARGELGSALAAAESCFRVEGADAADLRLAIDTALAVRRDHLPAIRALRELSRASSDREGLLRANRRLVAFADDDVEKARAHAELGALLVEADPPAARLHLDQALRLDPDDVEALTALAAACVAAGEHLRAVRALERLRERALARGDRAEAGRLALEAGVLWEERLASDENAWLRYAEAAELRPGSAEIHARAARAAERLGRWAEASDHHAAVLPLADAATADGRALAVRTRLALAEVAEQRLADLPAAAAHLEAASAAAPGDAALLQRLSAITRRLDRPAALLSVLDRLAPLTDGARDRAALLAEAGALAVSLGRPRDARERFAAAAALDPGCRAAHEGLARLAREAGDAVAEREALSGLLPLARDAAETATIHDAMAEASERAGDLAAAARSVAAARRAVPSAPRLDASLRLARRTGEAGEVAGLLAERAQRHRADGEPAEAARLWLERARLLGTSEPGLAMAAVTEARGLAPADPDVLRAQAELAERLGDPRGALGALRALLESGPADAPALDLRAGKAALAVGEFAAAREHAERAFARDAPGAGELLAAVLDHAGDDPGRAELLERLGRFGEAAELWLRAGDGARELQALERAARVPDASARTVARLAEARLAAGDLAGGAAALRRLAPLRGGRAGAEEALRAFALDADPAGLDVALACDPTVAAARAERATRRAETDPAGARADAEAALASPELPGDRRPALLRLAARLAREAGDAKGAMVHLGALADLLPGDDEPLAALADLQRDSGDPGLAATLERRLAVVDAAAATALRVELAALLGSRAGREDEAIALLRRALEAHEAEGTALRALLRPPLADRIDAEERLALLGRYAAHAGTPPDEAAAAHRERAERLAERGEPLLALEAARAAAKLAPEPDAALELRAALAEKAGQRTEAAGALLLRARRLVDSGDPEAGNRLAEAGLLALSAELTEPGEAALRAALVLGLDRELEGPALQALAAGARGRGDAAAELSALERLAPHLPTGERPAALLRCAVLLRDAGRLQEARAAATEGRKLSPRDPVAVELCRALAEAAGDLAEEAERLGDLATLEPGRAPELGLRRARHLAQLGRPEEADDAYSAALAGLPATVALAREQAQLRRGSPALAGRSPAEPLEAFAARSEDRRLTAEALREAVALAFVADDRGTALRCARKAWARTREEASFAGPLLARVLYLQGSRAEALVLHRALHESGYAGIDEADALTLNRQLAELAADEGDVALALAALGRLLSVRPQDHEAALARFALDPDRPAAARALATAADAFRSDAQRALALARAASSALVEARDAELAARWLRAARADAARSPRLALAVEQLHVATARAADLGPSVLLAALHDAAASALSAGDRAAARALLEEAVAEERLRAMRREHARDELALSGIDEAEGDTAAAAARALAAGALLEEAGDLHAALGALRRAFGLDRGSDAAAERLERVARTLGPEGAAVLPEVVAARAELAPAGPARAAALLRLAESLAEPESPRGAELLARAHAEDPSNAAIEERLAALLRALGRNAELAALLLGRADRTADVAERIRLTRTAAGLLSGSPSAEDRGRAADGWRFVFEADPNDLGAARAASDLLIALGRREEALPLLAALVRADPDDEPSAKELAEAYAGRHRERAELFLARAAPATGEAKAQRLREAARALFAAGDDRRARQVLRDAFDAWPADDDAFFAAIRDAAADIDRLDRVLSARAGAVPAEAVGCHRARADALLAFGRSEQALAAWEACADAAPGDAEILAAWADCAARVHGDAGAAPLDARIVALAEAKEGSVPDALVAPSRRRLGLLSEPPPEAKPPEPAAAPAAPGPVAEPPPVPAPAPADLPAPDVEALTAAVEAGPGTPGWDEAAARLAAHHRASGRPRDAATLELQRAEATAEPGDRCRAWVRGALALEAAGAEAEEVDAALGIAADADPDAAAPWLARAEVDQRRGDLTGAARAHLSVAIRTEGEPAARSALEAARIFEQLGRHEDAARAYRAAVLAVPGCVPARRVLAEEALARGDAGEAADHLLAIPLEEVPTDGRPEHRRALARAVEAAGRSDDAAERWLALFRDAPADVEPFEHAARLVLARDGLDAWLALAVDHEAAVAANGDATRRLALRHERGVLFAGAGRLEAARGAFLSALELDPGHAPTLDALDALDGRRLEWRQAADALAREAEAATDGAEAAATLLRRARILRERLADDDGALAALDEALVRARLGQGPAAERIAAEAEELIAVIGPARAPEAAPEPPSAPPVGDPVANVLRSQAAESTGPERAAHLERLAGHLERGDDMAGAADALLDAVEADPDRELTWSWLLSLVEHDEPRRARARAIRAAAGLEPMEPSPPIHAVPPLELPVAEEAPVPAPIPSSSGDFLFEPEQGAPATVEPIRFEATAAASPAAEPIRFEPEAALGVGLTVDPFAPPMPDFAGTAEPEPEVEFEGDSPVDAGAPYEPKPMEMTGPIRLDDLIAAEPPPEPSPAAEETRLEAAIAGAAEASAPPAPTTERVSAARAALMARWDAPPREQCALRRELGLALAEAGDLDGAIGALLGANASDPGDLESIEVLGRLHERAGKPIEALAWEERAADLVDAGPERAVRLSELARKAELLGDRDRAVWLWERVRAADHRYRSALEALCRLYAGAGDRAQLRLVAAELSDVAGDGALEPWAAPLGRAWMEAGKPEVAYAWLQRALRADPTDLTLARDLSRISEKIGSWGEYVRLGEVCADAFAAYDPLAAAARYRHFAEVLRDRLSDTERAAVMLEKALSLTPDDADGRRDLLGLWSARPETAQRALEGWLDAVRLEPADGPALVSLAETCRAVARDLTGGADAVLLERARIATSLAAFVSSSLASPPPLKLATAVPEELRERVSAPGATGSLARLLALLSPYLEPLFPADLARRGASASDRLVPPRAPELRSAVELAARTFSARPHALFLASRAGAEIQIENTQPPSLVAGAEVAALPEAALDFLAARTFDLLSRGWALAGKFAPKDVGILLELCCRYVGVPVATPGLQPQRAEAFLAALQKTVPPSVRERALLLAPTAGQEFATSDARRLTVALRRSANRVALLYTGEPGAALRALSLADRRGQADVDPVQALSIPDLRDLALFALSDPFVEMRAALVG